MPDSASVFQRVAIGRETTSGTAITPTRVLASMSLKPSPATETSQFKPAGFKWNTTSILNKEWMTSPVEGIPDFNELPYALCSVFRDVSPTTPGGGTLTRDWVIGPTTSSADTPASYTVEAGSEVRASRSTYGLFTDFGVSYTRNSGFSVTGNVIGQKYLDDKIRYIVVTNASGGTFTITVGADTTTGIAFNATPSAVQTAIQALASVGSGNATVTGTAGNYVVRFTGTFETAEVPAVVTVNGASLTGGGAAVAITRTSPTATQLDVRPVVPTQFEARFATTHAGLAAGTIFTRLLELSWNVTGRWGPIWTLNRSEGSWAAPVETEPTGEVTFKVGADDQGMPFLNNLRNGSTIFISADCTGDVIEGSFNYRFLTEMAVKITNISALEDTDGLVSVTFTGTLVHDATWGKAIECFCRNILTAL